MGDSTGSAQNSGSKLMHSVTSRVTLCDFDWILWKHAATQETEHVFETVTDTIRWIKIYMSFNWLDHLVYGIAARISQAELLRYKLKFYEVKYCILNCIL